MKKPEEFTAEVCQHDGFLCADRTMLTKLIAARDAEVREEKRREVVAEIEGTARFYSGQIEVVLLLAASLQPPAPVPSERSMRVAKSILPDDVPVGTFPQHVQGITYFTLKPTAERQRDIALLIDAEFGEK